MKQCVKLTINVNLLNICERDEQALWDWQGN